MVIKSKLVSYDENSHIHISNPNKNISFNDIYEQIAKIVSFDKIAYPISESQLTI